MKHDQGWNHCDECEMRLGRIGTMYNHIQYKHRNEIFRMETSDAMAAKFRISKREKGEFKYTGVDVKREENGDIVINQEAYKDTLHEIEIGDKESDQRPLTREEFKRYRGAAGQLQWLAEMTRPDLSYDCLEISRHNKDATVGDLRSVNKVIRKAKMHDTFVKYSHIGEFDDLKILAITDGAYLKLEEKTMSVMGRFLFLSNKEETKVSAIGWKGKTIPTVCKSAKDAETRAADKAIEDAVYIARCVKEIFTGDRGEAQIPVDVVTDSKPLIDSINSSRQVENKLLRPLVKFMKQALDSGMIRSIRWCNTKVCLADILTKKASSLTKCVTEILKTNEMINLWQEEERK